MFDAPVGWLPRSLKDRSEIVAFLALAGCVSLVLVSIAASEILLAVAIAAVLCKHRRFRDFNLPGAGVFLPLAAFALWSLIAALASQHVLHSLAIAKKFFLLLLIPLVPAVARGEGRLIWIYKAVFALAVVSSLRGLEQFARDPGRDLLHRISGFMSQWMTYSGLLMLALVMLIAFVLCFGLRRQPWTAIAIACVVLALVFSQTRNAWLGAVAGSAVLFCLRRPRSITSFVLAMLVCYLVSPASIKQRLLSGLDPSDPNTRNRIELAQTSVRLIRDHVWLGVGPRNVGIEALRYRGRNEYPGWMYQHMHNNFLQIASEMGIPGLILWIWLIGRLAWDALRVYRSAAGGRVPGESRPEALLVSSAALASWTAMVIAGLFEYNFGDSEVLILFLFTVSAPYVYMPYAAGGNRGNIDIEAGRP